jgi:hypothetical protein
VKNKKEKKGNVEEIYTLPIWSLNNETRWYSKKSIAMLERFIMSATFSESVTKLLDMKA